MMDLLLYRKQNANYFKNFNGNTLYSKPKTSANQVAASTSHTSIDTGASQPEILSETAWTSKMKEFAARSPADKKRLGKRCHICSNFGCHSQKHLQQSTNANQVKQTQGNQDDDSTSEESDGYVPNFDNDTNSLTCVVGADSATGPVVKSESNKNVLSLTTQPVMSSKFSHHPSPPT